MKILTKGPYGYNYIESLVQRFGSTEAVVSLYALNSHIANIEQMKLFLGDLAFYKTPDDIFKRMSLINATKESLRTDDEMNIIIDSRTHRFEKAQGYTGDYNNTRIRTLTINDPISKISEGYTEQEKSTLKKVFKDSMHYYEMYDGKIEEADGLAYITIDEIRRLSMRAAEWSTADEKLYQMLADNKISYTSETLHRWSMKKYQYSGKLFNEEFKNMNIPAGRKFAFLPLIPGLFPENSTLSKFNDGLLASGIGMAFYPSSAKFGYKTPGNNKAYHDMYEAFNFTENIESFRL